MQLLPIEAYSNQEDIQIAHGLNQLFSQWHSSATENLDHCQAMGFHPDDLVFDGIFPGYSSQSVKVLFIGREPIDIKGLNYINELLDDFHCKKVGNKPINSTQFHSLAFYLTYALNNKIDDWHKIPFADTLADTFGQANGISYGFMNLSKVANTKGWQSQWPIIHGFSNLFSNLNGINYFSRQINIIKPDLIITMNLGKNLHHLGPSSLIHQSPQVNTHTYHSEYGQIPLLDTFHFSAPGKSSKKDFFIPILKAYYALPLP